LCEGEKNVYRIELKDGGPENGEKTGLPTSTEMGKGSPITETKKGVCPQKRGVAVFKGKKLNSPVEEKRFKTNESGKLRLPRVRFIVGDRA